MSKAPYVNVVGCLMYDRVCSRLDLTQAESQVCKFVLKSGKRHWEAIKYLKGTTCNGIMFSIAQGDPSVVEFVDSGYVGDVDDGRSTT